MNRRNFLRSVFAAAGALVLPLPVGLARWLGRAAGGVKGRFYVSLCTSWPTEPTEGEEVSYASYARLDPSVRRRS